MSLELQDLRERTLANNLVWLRSFGCVVRREGNVVYVDNPEAGDYCALLLFAGPDESYEAFFTYASDARSRALRPNVYVDDDADSPRLKRLLTLHGCAGDAVSYVTAGEVSDGEAAGDVSVRAAEQSEIDQWASAYSLGFGRAGEEAVLDGRRWRLAFGREEVRHWFFIRRDEVVASARRATRTAWSASTASR